MQAVLKQPAEPAATTRVEPGPDWLTAEMPPGYRNRMAEIQRLLGELREMSRFSRLLCELGTPLRDLLRDLFTTLKFDAEVLEGLGGAALAVRLDGGRRLLISLSSQADPVEKRSPEVAHLFQVLQERAEEFDRVVLVSNVDPTVPPASRRAPLSAEALAFITRMGATHVTATALFEIWKLSLQEPARAREQVVRLYAREAGSFEPMV